MYPLNVFCIDLITRDPSKCYKSIINLFSIPLTGLTKMSFSPPVLTEEEDTLYGSKFLTDDLKCDGCLAISHQLHESFMKKYDNRPASLGLLSQPDVIELAGTLTMSF